MKKLYEVVIAIYSKKKNEYIARYSRENVIAGTVEEAIKKVKPHLSKDKVPNQFIDEVNIIGLIDIE